MTLTSRGADDPRETLQEALDGLELLVPPFIPPHCDEGRVIIPDDYNFCRSIFLEEWLDYLDGSKTELSDEYADFIRKRDALQAGYIRCISQGGLDCSSYVEQPCADRATFDANVAGIKQDLSNYTQNLEQDLQGCIASAAWVPIDDYVLCGYVLKQDPSLHLPPALPPVTCPFTNNPPDAACMADIVQEFIQKTQVLTDAYNADVQRGVGAELLSSETDSWLSSGPRADDVDLAG